MVWKGRSTGGFDTYFKGSTDNGTTFSNTPINLSNSGWSDDPQIISQITTSGNNVYVVWIDRSH